MADPITVVALAIAFGGFLVAVRAEYRKSNAERKQDLNAAIEALRTAVNETHKRICEASPEELSAEWSEWFRSNRDLGAAWDKAHQSLEGVSSELAEFSRIKSLAFFNPEDWKDHKAVLVQVTMTEMRKEIHALVEDLGKIRKT